MWYQIVQIKIFLFFSEYFLNKKPSTLIQKSRVHAMEYHTNSAKILVYF